MMLTGVIPGLGGPELLILLALGVMFFGRKLPDLGRSIGSTVTQFRRGLAGVEDEIRTDPVAVTAPPRVTPSPKPSFEGAPRSRSEP